METVETNLYYSEYIQKHPKFTGILIDCSGNELWLLNGKYHRTDGPAVQYINRSKSWYLNGEYLTKEEWTYTMRVNKLEEFIGNN